MSAPEGGIGEPEPQSVFWERTFREGRWDYLGSIAETPRYALIAGYIRRLASGGDVLDAGCGTGVLVDHLDIERLQYTGFDVSPTAIAQARDRHPGASLLTSSFEDFVCPAGVRYDVIVFNEVLATLERPLETLRRYLTFLKPVGYVLISQLQNPDPASKANISTRRLEVEIANRRYVRIATFEAKNCETGLTWRLYCLTTLGPPQ